MVNRSFFFGLTAVLAATTTLAASVGPKDRDPQSFGGYLGVVFKDITEQIYFITSDGSTTDFALLNNEKPVMASEVGTRGSRDPVLIRGTTDNFILATDNSFLATNFNFSLASRHASRKILVARSKGALLDNWEKFYLTTDLVPSNFGGVAAPEAIWDAAKNKWLLYFGANQFDAKRDPNHEADPAPKSQIWACYTADFKMFEDAFNYFTMPNGGGATDMTIRKIGKKEENKYVRFFRDDSDGVLRVRGQITSKGLYDGWTNLQGMPDAIKTNGTTMNGGPLIFEDYKNAGHYALWADDMTIHYVPFETSDIEKGTFTKVDAPNFLQKIQQGSVTAITVEEMDALKNKRDWPELPKPPKPKPTA